MTPTQFPRTGGLIRPYAGILSELFRAGDLVVVTGSLWLLTVAHDVAWMDAYTSAALLAVIAFVAWSQMLHLYGSWRIGTLPEEVYQVLLVWVCVVFTLLLAGYATKTSAVFSRRVFLSWLVLAPSLLAAVRVALRLVLRHLRQAGRNTRRAAIVGTGALAERLHGLITNASWLGLGLAGVIWDPLAAGKIAADPSGALLVGAFRDLITRANRGEVDVVFLAIPAEHQGVAERLTTELADSTVSLYYVPNCFLSDLLHARWGYLEEIPFLSLRETPFFGVDGTLKRIEDLVIASLILIVISLPMALIAAAIKLSSPGPILFKQRRYGLDGRQIEVWKFRTMTVIQDGDTIPQVTPNDERVTRLGAFLRRTSMDEFPQFINVVRGHMSLVGPRPHAVAHNEDYRKRVFGYMLRHKVKPGITGWAQISGWRGETDTLEKMEKRIEHDLWYIQNWSLWLDLRIIFRTAFIFLTDPHAY